MTTLLSLVLQATTHPAAQTLAWTLIHFLWQGTALGLLAWLALTLLRRASAKARYGMACAFLVLMVAAPAITFFALQPQPASALGQLTMSTEVLRSTGATPPSLTAAQRLKAALDPSLPWMLAVWAAGVLLLSTRFLGSWVRVQRLRQRSAVPVPAEWHLVLSRLCRDLKLTRTVRLLQSAAVEVPTALGWLRPVILLPACALSGLSPMQLEAILAHELAHIRRGDFLMNLLQSLVEVLLFYHPAIWWLSARIRSERELCCDDVAAELCGDPLLLARALTDLEALREPLVPAPTHLALAANGGSLMHRVRHLLYPALPITSGARVTALAVLAASLLGAAGVAMQDEGTTPKVDKKTHADSPKEERDLKVQIQGDVSFNGESSNPVSVPGDGSFRIEEKRGGKTLTYLATKAKTTYTVNGTEQPLDQEGKDWLREVLQNVKQNRSHRDHDRVVEIRTRHMEDRAKNMDVHAREMEAHARALEALTKDLDTRGASMTPEERTKIQAEADHLKAEGDKLKAQGERMKIEGERLKHDPELKALIAQAEKEGRKVRVETIRRHGEQPETILVNKNGDGKEVVIKRYKIKKDGKPGEHPEWSELEGLDEHALNLQIERDIHIQPIHVPRIHVQTFVHDEDGDPKAEMAEIQAEMKALQTRLEQLKHQVATAPKSPKAPKTPATPKSTHPSIPPPPPPPPPPAPDAPMPAPPPPPAPPAPPMPER